MELEKRKRFIINSAYIFMIAAAAVLLLKYVLPYMMPFAAAFMFAFLLKHPIRFLHEKCRLNRTLAAALLVTAFYFGVAVLFILLGIRLFTFIRELFYQMPGIYAKEIEPFLTEMFDSLERSVSMLDASLVTAMEELSGRLVSSLGEAVTGISMKVFSAVSNYASSLPGLLIRVLVTVISTFFLAADYDRVMAFTLNQLKEKPRRVVLEVKDYVIGTILKCVRSYALIMCITFGELSAGLTLLGVENGVLLALLIAAFDILPVLGTGSVLIPWIVVSSVKGDYVMAFGLLCLYLVVTIVRNILEPRLVGSQMGLHPLSALMSMFLGARFFGGVGMFGFPIALSLLKNLKDRGVFAGWE